MPPSDDTDDVLRDRLTALARDLILIRSTEADPDERGRAFEFLNHHLEAVPGLRIQTFENGGFTSLLALPDGGANPHVLLCGHVDVIDHPGVARYHSRLEGGRIVGPGAGDMKGAIAVMLTVLHHLKRDHPGASIGIAITSDEERGGEHGVRYLVEEVGLRCGIALIPDGGSLTEITVEEKGILHLKVSARGTAAHAARPWLGRNALSLLTGRLVALEAHFAGLVPPGAPANGDHWFPTAALTMLDCPNQTINALPDRAEAVLDIRFPPPHTAASMRAAVAQVLGPGLGVDTIISAEPTHLDSDPLFHAVTEEVAGRPVTEVRTCGGSDARFFRNHGIPVNLSRPLVGDLHGEHEWIDVGSMLTYYRIADTYIRRKLGLG